MHLHDGDPIIIIIVIIIIITILIIEIVIHHDKPGHTPVRCIASNIEDWIDQRGEPHQDIGGYMSL